MDLLAAAVTNRESGGQPYTLVDLTGEADGTTTGMLRDLLEAQIARKPGMLIIDLAGLRFMDSAALHVILTASRSLAGQGGSLALVSPTRVVAAVLRLTQAARMVPVYESLPEALAG
jgi:anti-sigma B factor antagonist